MLTVFCTNKLASIIDIVHETSTTAENEQQWSAHLVAIGGRKCICFMDKKTLYSILLVDVLKKELKNIDQIFYSAFMQQLKDDGIYNPELERDYLEKFSSVRFSKTDNDRKTMGTLRDVIMNLKVYCETKSDKLAAARHFAAHTMNLIPLGSRKYAQAKELMRLEMKRER